jgi:hypothetical protein
LKGACKPGALGPDAAFCRAFKVFPLMISISFSLAWGANGSILVMPLQPAAESHEPEMRLV